MASGIGAVTAVVFGGIGAMGIAGIWAVIFPEILKIKKLGKKELG